ncbi:unnamed protein product [Bursaphelenchus okinawaensis]|uniref:Uncharacterized protein n=1 Tax=Bursaphelenchus okinawaensis TaxID=465554 RepID=A0A811KIX0_9BILA|nr:unnamed protein product [Bursaphelenchus okinawaensis]CAG9103827.1 unnamed protein product [Bursaphelenchus okinawaensis]
MASSSGALLLGTVVKINRIGIKQIPCAQVRCRKNVFNNFLKAYFAEPNDLWALDKSVDVKLGDTVLVGPIEQKDRPMATVSHIVKRVVMPYGNIIDPVTKKRIYQKQFVEDQEIRHKLIGDITDTEDQEVIGFETRHQENKERLNRLKEQQMDD